MARKKKSRKKQKLKNNIKVELIGLLMIFLAIFGSGAAIIQNGAISKLLANSFRFFLGNWYFVVPAMLLYLGIYLMIKRNWPNINTRRWYSTYIILSGLLLMTHIQLFEALYTYPEDYPSVIGKTFTTFFEYTDGEKTADYLGGGLAGSILFAVSFFLFSNIGSKIVAFFLIIVGIILFINLSIGDLLIKLSKKTRSYFSGKWENWSENKNSRKQKKQESEEIVEEVDDKEIYPSIAYATNPNLDNDPIEEVSFVMDQDKEQEKDQEAEDTKREPENGDSPEEVSVTDKPLAVSNFENEDYQLPPIQILEAPKHQGKQQEKSYIQRVVRKLEKTFQSFGVKARVTKVHVGPSVTKYEVYPEAGVKVSKIVNLHDDLALALAAKDIRIEAPIPGKSAVGIEVPNEETAMVTLREVLESKKALSQNKLAFALGKDISGESVVAELNKMPHLLVAGATGSGKSVCINGIITSILMYAKPHEVKMMMIDPKKVELNVYNGIPHLLSPVVTDPKKASRALKKIVAEMERRYDLFSDTGTRNMEGYNDYIIRYNQDNENKQPLLPYIVVIVDELADLMMVASSDVEDAITRLAQMARAAGIHLVIATQRPSVDVITGVIKANIPSRIAFSVSSQTDSRTILDSGGAEKLLGRGDMLFIPVGLSKPLRIQGAFLSDDEVERVVDHCIEQQKAQYQDEMIPEEENEVSEEVDDDLYPEAVSLVVEMQSASVSMLQRRFRVGYTRAARLIDAMEQRGIVGPYEGSKPRTVLVSDTESSQPAAD
ncbi:DNA translocase FtsK [Gracilibacillus ureilyticus]|uniref:DNA translocase FtsK n=1 Tax=Gracilibacillus ureilyticus TaxID=531814 RepID=A0A1H9LAF7_9BACI|nr:DNA translocase FtsK [Gracilibacillus ureilyticus]